MQQNTEQEWQFAAPELDTARRWLESQTREISERRFAPRPTLRLRDTYYDSADWMIYRAGYALRLRRSSGDAADAETAEITLKSLSAARDGIARRTEISERVPMGTIDGALSRGEGIGEHIRALVGMRPLTELFSANTTRERRYLLEADTELPLAEVDLDETTLEAPGGAAKDLKRVEIECLNAEPAALEAVVHGLRDAGQLVPAETSKFREGLALSGLKPDEPRTLGPRTIHATQPFLGALIASLRRYFAVVLDREPHVRLGTPAAVHEMRVAARHLDALLRATRKVAPSWAGESHGAVRALIKQLGAIRDCDVQLADLAAKIRSAPENEQEALVPLRERLTGTRDRARERLLRELDSPRYRAFHDTWLAKLPEDPPERDAGSPENTTAAKAMKLIRKQARKLRKRADALGPTSSAEDYHDVRIVAKRLRYLMDAFESLYGPAAREYGDALARLQNVLGRFHDVAVRDQRYTELVASAALPPLTSFAIGRLVERDASAFDECRRKFPKAYRRVRRRRWAQLLAAMQRQADAAGAGAV